MSLKIWACALTTLLCISAAHAQGTNKPAVANAQQEEKALQAAIVKINAYVKLMNRTLRASESIDRYKSWVNMQTGPTGKERNVYGLYSVYDVTREMADVTKALESEPKFADLDAAMRAYMKAYADLAVIVNEASAYYERQDYRDDKMAGAKQWHAKLAPAAETFLAARANLEKVFKIEKTALDQRELALVEKTEGRKAHWHVRNLMIHARGIVEDLVDEQKTSIDVAGFEKQVADYAAALKDLETFKASQPGELSNFESHPRAFLAALRDLRDKASAAKGDLRKVGFQPVQGVVNTYNALISAADNALR